MNIREISQPNPHYYDINRGERNYAAILYAALRKEGNAARFLQTYGIQEEIGSELAIYFEHAYLVDLWNTIGSEDIRKEIIKQILSIKGIDDILQAPVTEINRQFGAVNVSSKEIQYPTLGWRSEPRTVGMQHINTTLQRKTSVMNRCRTAKKKSRSMRGNYHGHGSLRRCTSSTRLSARSAARG